MAEQTPVKNPFEDEKPKLVHFEKDESHYEYCRIQMREIDRTHRRTFLYNMILCIAVCLLAIFQKYVGGFCMMKKPDLVSPGSILALGIFQIFVAMIVMALGYLAWANYHTLIIILESWYAVVLIIGIVRLDYLTGIVGVAGMVIYIFSLRAMQKENGLSEMEGYPDFQEKFDIEKSDIVIQTLLAHKGEKRTKSTLFTTDYSLRRRKKKHSFDASAEDAPSEGKAGEELAEELKRHLKDARDAKSARTAIAALDAVSSARERAAGDAEKAAEQPAAKTAYYRAARDCSICLAASDPEHDGAEIVYEISLHQDDLLTADGRSVTVNGEASTPATHFRAGRYPDTDYTVRLDETESFLRDCLLKLSPEEYRAASAPQEQPEVQETVPEKTSETASQTQEADIKPQKQQNTPGGQMKKKKKHR